jgi:hypothetical protein
VHAINVRFVPKADIVKMNQLVLFIERGVSAEMKPGVLS